MVACRPPRAEKNSAAGVAVGQSEVDQPEIAPPETARALRPSSRPGRATEDWLYLKDMT